jgi:hypothetical protein
MRRGLQIPRRSLESPSPHFSARRIAPVQHLWACPPWLIGSGDAQEKRNKSKKVQLTLTRITLWEIELAPCPDASNADALTNLSSPFPLLYRDIGMVMIGKKGLTS